MIVKIQQSLNNDNVLAYNKDKSIFWQGEITPEVKKKMGNKLKVYFDAEMVGTEIALNYKVDKQGW